VSLTISIWNSEGTPVDELVGDVSFGFERFRSELWGTEAVRDCGALLIPLLADQDLYVDYRQLDVLEADAHRLKEAAPAIADRLFDVARPGEGVVVVQERELGSVHDAWGGISPAGMIVRYLDNLLRAIATARQSGSGLVIW
jgi:hypothetical protein